MSIAALRATIEETVEHDGRELDVVRGTLLADGATRGVLSRRAARGSRRAC